MPSFDIVSKIDSHELTNAVDQANREVTTRFDFKDTGARFEYDESKKDESKIIEIAQNAFQLEQMTMILNTRLTKRGIDIKCLTYEPIQESLHEARKIVKLKQGIDKDTNKKIIKLLKESDLKVQSTTMGDYIRVTGKKRDDLQMAISLLRTEDVGTPLQFENFRD